MALVFEQCPKCGDTVGACTHSLREVNAYKEATALAKLIRKIVREELKKAGVIQLPEPEAQKPAKVSLEEAVRIASQAYSNAAKSCGPQTILALRKVAVAAALEFAGAEYE